MRSPRQLVLPVLLSQIIIITVSGCINLTQDFHPKHYDALLHRLDTVASVARSGEILRMLDSSIQAGPAGAGDKARLYERKGSYFMENKNYAMALSYTDSLLKITQPRQSNEAFARLYTNALLGMGDINAALNNFDESLRFYAEAKSYAESVLRDSCVFSGYHTRIGNIYFKLTRFKLAAKHFKMAFEEEIKCNKNHFDEFVYGQMNLTNTALAYNKAYMPDSAEVYLVKALHFIEQRRNQFPAKASFIRLCIGVIDGNYADVRTEQRRYSEAETFFTSSIEKTDDDLVEFANSCRIALARMYIKWGKLKEAEKLIQSFNLRLQYFSLPKTRMAMYSMHKEMLEAQNNPGAALHYSNLYVAIKDSVDRARINDIERDMEIALENKQQKITNSALAKKNKLRLSQLIFIGLLALMAMLTGAFIWYNLKRTRKHNRTLADLNTTIEESNLEIRKQNISLHKAYLSLEDISRQKTRIMRAVAHDLKNPISGIYSLTYILLKKPQAKETLENLEIIQTTAKNSLTLINELIKEDSIEKISDRTSVDLTALTTHCVELLHPRARQKNQRIIFNTDTSFFVFMSQEKIWRVINNIINNAIKFSYDNSCIHLLIRNAPSGIILSVEDEGVGIPETLKEKIFTTDHAITRAGTNGEETNGLGLIICQEIMLQHGGSIWFESVEGVGTTFYILFPSELVLV